MLRRSLAAASIAGVLAATVPPAGAAVIYSVNGVNVGTSTTGAFTTSTLYVGFGTGTFTTSPTNIVGGILIGAPVAASYTTNVVLANTSPTGKNVTVATGTTTLTGSGFAALTNNYGTINNGGGQTLTNTYTFVPGAAGTVRGVAASVNTSIIGSNSGSQITDTTNIVLISNWVAPVQSTTMTATSLAGSVASTVTGATASSASAMVYVLPGQSGAATVKVNNVGDGNMAADATTITKGYGNLAGSTTSAVSATGAGGFSLASSSAAFSLNDSTAANIPPAGSIVPTTSTDFTYTYAGAAARGTSASATLTVQFTNGNSNNTNASQTGTYSVIGRTVAPQQSVSATASALYALPGQTGTVQKVVIANVGDGNLVGANLNGSIAASVAPTVTLSTSSAVFSLTDATGPSPIASSTTTVSLTYTGAATRGAGGTVASVVTTFTNGSADGKNNADSATTVFTGQTVAPVQSVAAAGTTLYALPGASASGTLTIKNIGDGSLAGATLDGTLGGTNGSGFSTVLPNSTAINVRDALDIAGASTLTQTVTYTGAAVRGASSTATVTANFTNGSADGSNAASAVSETFKGQTVAPVAATSTSGGATLYVLAGSGESATQTLTIANTGDGSLAGATLNGSLTTTTGGFFTAAVPDGSFALKDGANGSTATTLTQTVTYVAESVRSGTLRTASASAIFTNGNADGTNTAAAPVNTSFSAQTVAPVGSVTATAFAPVRAGSGASSTATVVISNIGDGNKAGTGTKYNLNGSTGAATPNPPFAGSGSSFSLQDGQSTSYAFTFTAPATRGTSVGQVTTSLTNGSKNGANSSETVVTTLTGEAVGPVYGASVVGDGTINNGERIYFGEFVGGLTVRDLLISNLSNDAASAPLTDLTLTSISISDANEFSFSLSGFNTINSPTSGVVSNLQNGTKIGDIQIQFNNLTSKTGQAYLTIQTDEGAGLGATGSVYVYDLRWTVPEPGTIMVLGTGLLGLAISRRNRRGKAEAVRLTRTDDKIA